ncbi:hypothetical protein IGB42_03537 [Andreprevotia sp. IGB-42]|uniref:SOS response-associated peptidase n=1 Tax=Andreprevotia sp. IGB-42 TaxID=2497473 RepID=UPI00135B628D|nr:SOS response-associated peptidase family protein [Andreprevotia sp. IGB-42]KAF0811995.1 hypothetical protein IGB42_03537 [Andreprevotia sp. IGB-42]
MPASYRPTSREELARLFGLPLPDGEWAQEAAEDSLVPIVIQGEDGRPRVVLASFGMVPKDRVPPNARHFATTSAPAETIDEKRSYRVSWQKGFRCLVPMTALYETSYEHGKPERYAIGLPDGAPFAVAGIWRPWLTHDGEWRPWHGSEAGHTFSFSHITVNADNHPVMRRMRKPGAEKRSLVIVAAADHAGWLSADQPQTAHSYLALPDAESLAAQPAAGQRTA